ncbi:unnamed protein product [Malus baccata var. baccata]
MATVIPKSFSNRITNSSRLDRFSNLPIEIAHQILSHLNFEDLIRVGCVSKTCRKFYVSTPYLNFHDFYGVLVNISTRRKNRSVLDSLSRFFIQRGVHHKIQCFRFCWYLCDYNEDAHEVHFQSRLREWIEIAVRCNVEVLHLVITPITFGELPPSLLLCKSLKSLLVDMICNLSVVPTMDFFLSNLEYLRLKDVSIKDDDDRFFKWPSGSCTSIKELLLENCLGVNNLVIESSSLESFWYLKKVHFDAPIGLVNISAPNLKYLEWFGEFKTCQNLGNLMFLEKAMIYSTTQISNFDVLFDFLCSIRKVKVLILDPIILESNVIEFAYYKLEHAHDLGKMTIYYFQSHRYDVHDVLIKLRTAMMSKGIHFQKNMIHHDYQVVRFFSSVQPLAYFVYFSLFAAKVISNVMIPPGYDT